LLVFGLVHLHDFGDGAASAHSGFKHALTRVWVETGVETKRGNRRDRCRGVGSIRSPALVPYANAVLPKFGW
jgi:hypothetical protein